MCTSLFPSICVRVCVDVFYVCERTYVSYSAQHGGLHFTKRNQITNTFCYIQTSLCGWIYNSFSSNTFYLTEVYSQLPDDDRILYQTFRRPKLRWHIRVLIGLFYIFLSYFYFFIFSVLGSFLNIKEPIHGQNERNFCSNFIRKETVYKYRQKYIEPSYVCTFE